MDCPEMELLKRNVLRGSDGQDCLCPSFGTSEEFSAGEQKNGKTRTIGPAKVRRRNVSAIQTGPAKATQRHLAVCRFVNCRAIFGARLFAFVQDTVIVHLFGLSASSGSRPLADTTTPGATVGFFGDTCGDTWSWTLGPSGATLCKLEIEKNPNE